jgi:tetratricopeptide (TPR) repeat protein
MVWDLTRPLHHLEFAPRLDAARAKLLANADDPAALATLGLWYAFRGCDDWAVRLLDRARSGGEAVSPLALARCYWQLGRPADAAREYRNAIARNEAPADYLRLCLAAVERPSATPATRPATRPTTAP